MVSRKCHFPLYYLSNTLFPCRTTAQKWHLTARQINSTRWKCCCFDSKQTYIKCTQFLLSPRYRWNIEQSLMKTIYAFSYSADFQTFRRCSCSVRRGPPLFLTDNKVNFEEIHSKENLFFRSHKDWKPFKADWLKGIISI